MAPPILHPRVFMPDIAMAPCPVHSNLGLYHSRPIVGSSLTWTSVGGGVYYLTAAQLRGSPTEIFSPLVYELRTNVDLNTGYQWVAASGDTGAFRLEAAGGGDPGIFPGILLHPIYQLILRANGVALNKGNDWGSLANNGWTVGCLQSEGVSFHSILAQLTGAADDPDSKTMTADFWVRLPEGSDHTSLAPGEWKVANVGGELRIYVRRTDGANPNGLTDDSLLLDYDMSSTGVPGEESHWHKCIVWAVPTIEGGLANWPARYRTTTDPRRWDHDDDQISLATKDYRGWGRGYVLMAGTHSITWHVINQLGEHAQVTVPVPTIAADTRTPLVVAPSGGDYTSVPALLTAVGSSNNIRAVLKAGTTTAWGTAYGAWSGKNWHVVVENSGKGIIEGPPSSFGGLFDLQGNGIVIDGITVNPMGDYTSGAATRACFRFNGCKHVAIFNIDSDDVRGGGNMWYRGFFTTNHPEYVTVQNADPGDCANYRIGGEKLGPWDFFTFTNVMLDPNPGDNSVGRSPGGSMTCWNYCPGNAGTDNALRIRDVSDCTHIYGCGPYLGTGSMDFACGPNNNGAAPGRRLRVDSNIFKHTTVDIAAGNDRLCVVNNVFLGIAFGVFGNAELRLGNDLCVFQGNTFVTANGRMATISPGVGVTLLPRDVSRCEWKHNLNVYTPGMTYSTTSGIQLALPLTAHLGVNELQLEGNTFINPATFGQSNICAETRSGGATFNITTLNANVRSVGEDNAIASVRVDAHYVPNPADSPPQWTTPGVLFEDMWGNPRGATTPSGAAVAADPGPTAEESSGGSSSALAGSIGLQVGLAI